MVTATGKGRKSPSASATKFRVGARRRGLDGKIWVIHSTYNGTRRWVREGRPRPKPRRRRELAAPAERTAATRIIRRARPALRKGRKFTNIAVARPGCDWETNVGRRVKLTWIHISAGYAYLSAGLHGGKYWVLRNIPLRDRPRITFTTRTNTMRINTYRVRFARPQDLEFARECLAPFARKDA